MAPLQKCSSAVCPVGLLNGLTIESSPAHGNSAPLTGEHVAMRTAAHDCSCHCSSSPAPPPSAFLPPFVRHAAQLPVPHCPRGSSSAHGDGTILDRCTGRTDQHASLPHPRTAADRARSVADRVWQSWLATLAGMRCSRLWRPDDQQAVGGEELPSFTRETDAARSAPRPLPLLHAPV